ncbi:cilia- and flagella-associated protein 36 isoform X2 [Nasonia vitripennis]|uniref:Cilia- and flagella-associated protein 36 n=1 Tax=Nasonia vitripennis TaxID=7425 RepID=A0A7M7QCQ6_NASVI|nr:cilia- and flagella-associated protein 36 isoform X2 [Nasonia vitripennis]XP_032455734.1 cilia- and flagella-associated protein 36 isoform X2 [Nasonia vitripennis]
MAEKDDSAWVFDSLVGFLQGPIWSAPLLTFIEEKSLIFEPETLDSKGYREIYQEYKNLVDLLLGCYMEDMGITPEQFERACTLNKSTRVSVQFQQSLFEQIWAANEYEVFKRMMIQKNLELQLQALKMIEQKYGLTPASLTQGAGKFLDDELPMEELLQKETQVSDVKQEIDVDVDRDENAIRQEHERLATEYRNESALLKEALKKSTDTAPTILEEDEQETEFNGESDEETDQERAARLVPTKADFSIKPKEEAREEDIRKRQLYLKAQRDKLVALKKQARSQKLEADSPSVPQARPSSARVVAEATIDGKKDELIAHQQQAIDASILQVRKALAARLKAEVVQK